MNEIFAMNLQRFRQFLETNEQIGMFKNIEPFFFSYAARRKEND